MSLRTSLSWPLKKFLDTCALSLMYGHQPLSIYVILSVLRYMRTSLCSELVRQYGIPSDVFGFSCQRGASATCGTGEPAIAWFPNSWCLHVGPRGTSGPLQVGHIDWPMERPCSPYLAQDWLPLMMVAHEASVSDSAASIYNPNTAAAEQAEKYSLHYKL